MFRLIRRWMFRFVWAALLAASFGISIGWIRSHWRQDVLSIGLIREMSSESEVPKRFQGLKLTWMSGNGGMGLAIRNVQQFYSPPGLRTELHRQTSSNPAYPDDSITMGLWIEPRSFFITAGAPPSTIGDGSLIFVGTIAENGTPIAHIQELRPRSGLLRKIAGDRVGNGRVIDVSMDEIVYQSDTAAEPTRIRMYHDLAGNERPSRATNVTGVWVGGPGSAGSRMTPVPPSPPAPPQLFVATVLGSGIHPQWKTGDVTYLLIAPYWSVMAAMGIVGALLSWPLWRALRRWRLTRQGRCGACGYDLRATPARCPECGAVPEESKGVAI